MSSRSFQTPKLRSVVAATDLSDTAAIGLNWAAEIAVDHGARLHLVHVLGLTGWAMEYGDLEHGIRARLEAEAAARLEAVADELRVEDLRVTWEVGTGVPSSVIVAAAAGQRANLLVLGTRGLRGLDYLLLGSTAQRVVQRAHCPVLTVHPQDADRQRPVRRILAASDFSAEAETALETSLMLLGGAPEATEVLLLHAYHVPYELGLDSVHLSAAAGLQQLKRVKADVERRLEKLAAPLRQRGISVELLAVEGYPPEVIVDQTAASEADLVVLGTHGRTGLAHVLLGSTAERVIHKASCPVLTVRRQQPSRGHPGVQ